MIFTALLWLLFAIIRVIMAPIDLLVTSLLPSLGDAFSNIATYITQAFSYAGWVISLSGIPAPVIALVVAYYAFKLTAPLIVWSTKLTIKWYKALK